MLKSAYGGKDGMLPLFYILSWPLFWVAPDYERLALWLQFISPLAAPWLVFGWLSKQVSLRAAALAVIPTVWFFAQYANLA
jgi:hypothetical protein